MNKKVIFGIVALAIVVLTSSIWFVQYREKPPTPPIEPIYPEDWERFVEDGPFPDKDVKKVITLKKTIHAEGAIFEVAIELKIISTKFTDLKDIKEELRNELNRSGLPILNESTILVNNREGYDLLAGTSDWKCRQVVFLANGMAYMFKYSSQEIFYLTYEEVFDNFINSSVVNEI